MAKKSKKSSSASFIVLVGKQGQNPKGYLVRPGTTVRQALEKAGFDADTLTGSVTLNEEIASMSAKVAEGDNIRVTPKVAGGR